MPVVRGEDCPIHQHAPGIRRQFLVNGRTGATALSVVPAEWQPGFGPLPHQHGYEEVFLFLAGTGEGEVDGERVEVRPGTAVIVPAGTRHSFTNTGTTPLGLVAVYDSPDQDGASRPSPVCPDDVRPLVCLP